MPARRLTALLCVMGAANTVSIGAFPALLPEVTAGARLADWQLGAVAGAYGLARMVANVPAGLFMTHHLGRALLAAPFFLVAGALLMAGAEAFITLLLGRVLMGVGHTLATLGALTAILRYHGGSRLAFWLSAMEFAAMAGVLTGAGLLALLPRSVPWPVAWLLACSPIAASLVLVPMILRRMPKPDGAAARPFFARSQATADVPMAPGAGALQPAGLAVLAFAAGGTISLSYATVEQFLVPVRGSREFGLDRTGIARLLMLSQTMDIATLLPLGALADRRGTARVLGGVLLVFALAMGLIGFGNLPLLVVGSVLFGVSMACWVLPVGLLRSATLPAQVAWRTALYRVFVDGGMFLGPFVSGLLTARHSGLLPGVLVVLLATVGVALLAAARVTARWR